MLFRGGGIGHTWKHNTSKANALPENFYEQLGMTGEEISDDQGPGNDDGDGRTGTGTEHGAPDGDDEVVDAAEYVDSDWDDDEMDMETD